MLTWIDALRGLAILMVLANHVALVVPGLSAPTLALARFGQMGVQLFFVASAYTLCLSWQQRRADELRPTQRFLLRRFFRIAPLYWLGIALFATLHVVLGDATEPGPYNAANVLANLLFVHGFVPSAQNSIVPGGWSIGTEMAFYALFPLAVSALGGMSARATAGVALVALAANLLWQATQGLPVANNGFSYFHLINQLPVFLLGMALYQAHRANGTRLGPLGALALAALALLATAGLWRSGWGLAFAVVPTLAGLAFVALAHAVSQWPSPWRWLQAVGRASYAIYIVHIVLAWHGLQAVAQVLPLRGDIAYAVALAVVTGLSYGAALALGRWVERPGIALGRRLMDSGPRRRALGLG